MPVVVRRASKGDAPAIARLTSQLGYDVSVPVTEYRISSILSQFGHSLFVGEDEGECVGFVHALVIDSLDVDRFVMIGALVVDRARRQQGIGRLLMQQAEAWAQEHGGRVVRLWSSAGRVEAHGFYEGIGYTNIKTQYSFAKTLSLAGHADVDIRTLVPRL